MEIKDIYRKVLHTCDCQTIKECVEDAVKNRVDLSNADLHGADLSGADLRCVKLSNANLIATNLSCADLSYAGLKDANLSCAKLNDTDLRCAYLSNANLFCADLSDADLCHADLSSANLSNANLSCVNLVNAYLCSAHLWRTNLCGSYLRDVNLSSAELCYADLSDVDLSDADLFCANLRGTKNVPFIPTNLPEGEFIAYKKVKDKIVKIKVLEDSKRSRATTDKCRCDKALVLEIQELNGEKSELTEIINNNYEPITYKVGKIAYSDSWDENRWNECSHGIHFFLDREKAVTY